MDSYLGRATYTGATAVNLGTYKLGANGGATNTPFGTNAGGVAVYTGAVLNFNGFTIPTTEALTINGRGISDGGALIGSTGTFGGTIAQGTDSRITNASGTMTITGAVSGAFLLYVGGAGNITTSAVFPAVALGITKQGAGTLTVTGANLYTGATRVEAGTFAYAGTTTLVATPLTVLGGTFNNGANADTIGTVTLIGGTITNSAALTAATSYTLESGTISGILAGAIPVVKNTNNTVTLTGVNTISSTTTINAGTLAISGSGSATATTITVNLGGTLTLDNTTTAVASRLGDALALTLNGGNFNFIGNTAGASSETTGALTFSTGHNTVTVTPGAGGSTTMTFASFARTAGATALFRGTSLGSNAAANVSTLVFTATPTLTGAGGASGSATVSVIKGAFGDSSLSGTGSDMVTYQGGAGLRLLNGAGFANEYSGDFQTANANVKLTADRAAVATNTNSLILNGFGITNPGGAITIPISSASLAGNILINSATNIAGANTTLGIGTTELPILATANSTISAIIGTAAAGFTDTEWFW
jgi:fibronectin-binding autotransporter adhesin